jgi:hypothetical protein
VEQGPSDQRSRTEEQRVTNERSQEPTYSPFPFGEEEPPFRWGDYLGAAVDPADTSKVWVVGEYGMPGAPAGVRTSASWSSHRS